MKAINYLLNYSPIKQYLYYQTLDSTMNELDRIRAFIDKDQDYIIRAETQMGGMGRGKNQWHSPVGGLWFSLSLHLDTTYSSMALYIGFCLHKTLLQMFPEFAPLLMIKWTNDIYYENKKMAGILVKHCMQDNSYQIGIGINTNVLPDSTLELFNAISTRQILGFDVSNDYLLWKIVENIFANLTMLKKAELYLEYCNNHLYAKGKRVEIESAGIQQKGKLLGINSDGALLLDTDSGKKEIIYSGSLRELFS